MGYQSAATVAEMDGKKLKAVLAKHGYKPAHLAKALGVSETATSKYTAAIEWQPAMWATIVSGLEKLGIDPGEVRASYTMRRERPAEDLRPLTDHFPAGTLAHLRTLLAADEPERQRIGRPQFGHALAALDTCFPQSAHVISPIPTACHRRAKNKLNFVLDHWFSRG